MAYWRKNKPLAALLVFFCACTHKPVPSGGERLQIMLSPDSSSVRIAGLPHQAMLELTAPGDTVDWSAVFPVYKETRDSDLVGLEPLYPGTYRTAGDTLIFKPDSGFVRHNVYRVEVNLPGYYSAAQAPVKGQLPARPGHQAQTFKF